MDQLQAFSNSPMRASRIISTNVVNLQHESLGDIKDMVIDQATGKVAYAVVSFGGFLGMGEKLFAIPFSAFTYKAPENEYVLDVNKDKLKNAPGFDSGHWPTMTDEKWNLDQHSFYDRTPYWDRAPKAEPRVN
jgi:sporulation protein YlmC with PRC-barrel domain